MTNNQHGQVPEALIDLIDAYAETRHRCGGIYNARTEAARNAVIEALSGVQALSAAPAVHASVKGAMWFTKKPVTIQAIQWTGDNLREVITFTDGPPDTRSHHAGMAWDAYRDLVARDGLKIYTLEGKMLASPGDWIIRGVKGELYPCKPDIFQETYAAASPTPPAEQQAVSSAVLKAIREANMQLVRTGDDAFMLVPYKVATVEQQAAPKAAPTRTALPEGWTDCTIEFGNDGPEVVAYGPKRMMTRLAKWLGKYFAQVIAEADPKAAPGEPSDTDIDAFLDSPGGIEWVIADKRERYRLLVRAVLAKWAAPQQEAQEPVAWESTTPCYIKYITQARYEKFSPAVRRWYKPYRCSGCAERGAGFDACDIATAAAQGFRDGQSTTKQEE